MTDDLITLLRALAAGRHDDVSVAVDAVIEIERLRTENARLRARIAEYFGETDTHPMEDA